MQCEKIETLGRLRGDFHLFSDSPAVPEELIRSGWIPPLPVMGEYLVWGFSLLEAAGNFGIASMQCREIESDPSAALRLALSLENRTDNYSWREKEALLRFIRNNRGMEVDDAAKLIQSEGSFLPGTEKYMSLRDDLKTALNTGLVDLKTAEQLICIPRTVFTVHAGDVTALSYSSRRQLLVMLAEIIKRDGLEPRDAEQLAAAVFSSSRPLETVREKRYPRLTDMETKVRRFREEYLKGSGIELTPPVNFEGSAYTVKFPWRSEKQLKKIIKTLENMESGGDGLFKLLF